MTTYAGTLNLTGTATDSLGDSLIAAGSAAATLLVTFEPDGTHVDATASASGDVTISVTFFDGSSNSETFPFSASSLSTTLSLDNLVIPLAPFIAKATDFGIDPNAVFSDPNAHFSFNADDTVISANVASSFQTPISIDLFGVHTTADAQGNVVISGTLSEEVCFCRGTRILTSAGEVAVEQLAVGDKVVTLSGATQPIRWIGCGRALVTRRNPLARPIVVRRGALADGVPQRDLYLTHGHALYVDCALIPVELLVNHRSIAWDDSARVVEYYHIELDDHDVVFADGAPAESYYDAGNRAAFETARPGSVPGTARPTFAPVLTSGEIVETVWARLFARAGGRIERNTTCDPDLHLVIDGERLDPGAPEDGVYRFAVGQPPAASLLLRSRRGVPSLLGLGRSDHRRLGVAIRQVVLDHCDIPTRFAYDAPQLRHGGCHRPEAGYCWTDGELELPARFFTLLTGPFTLVVHTQPHHDMRYPLKPPLAQAA